MWDFGAAKFEYDGWYDLKDLTEVPTSIPLFENRILDLGLVGVICSKSSGRSIPCDY